LAPKVSDTLRLTPSIMSKCSGLRGLGALRHEARAERWAHGPHVQAGADLYRVVREEDGRSKVPGSIAQALAQQGRMVETVRANRRPGKARRAGQNSRGQLILISTGTAKTGTIFLSYMTTHLPRPLFVSGSLPSLRPRAPISSVFFLLSTCIAAMSSESSIF